MSGRLRPWPVRRPVRIALNLVVTGGIVAFLLWQIDVERTVSLIGDAGVAPLAGALGIFLVTTVAMAWRWQLLLAAKGIREPIGWLVRNYFVGYAAGQVLPTSLGGDAVRIIEHARRRPEAKGEAAGAVLIERGLGSVGTLLLVAVGLGLAVGRYDDVEVFYVLEGGLLAACAVVGWLLFSRRGERLLVRLRPLGRLLRIERAMRSLYSALHGYRHHPGTLVAVVAVTLVTQTARLFAIWLCGEAVGVELSPLPYFVLGPLLFLVMMVPFTINGLGVREVFFVTFLGRFAVDADLAFATGFLFYAVTVATSLPGGLILLWRSARPLLVRRARTVP
jgi:uncharacterized protein (TIRG00374 family)